MRKHKSLGVCRVIVPVLMCVVLFISGCTHMPAYVNKPAGPFVDNAGYRYENLAGGTNSESLLVVLAFSGGGTRAAALSYGVLEQLARDRIVVEGNRKRVLDEVDVISSVSGGSFTAAYYALFGDRIFDDFESRFLNRNIQGALLWRIACRPDNWVRLALPWYSRSDLAAQYYDRSLFDRNSYSNLLASNHRPYLVINATDMALGSRFEFTQPQFDLLNSDLGTLPVARAVAASSAFPGLLTPITVRDYPSGPDYRHPDWLDTAMEDREINLRRYKEAVVMQSYLDKNNRPFIHLVDGGVSDNLGLRGTLRSLESTDGDWSLRRDIQARKVKTVVVITVNARTDPEVEWNRHQSAPGPLKVLTSSGGAPMANYSFETAERIKEDFHKWQQDGGLYNKLRGYDPNKYAPSPFHEVKFYPIEVSFDGITNSIERAYFNNIGTSFRLSTTEVRRLRDIAASLLSRSQEYKLLLQDYAR